MTKTPLPRAGGSKDHCKKCRTYLAGGGLCAVCQKKVGAPETSVNLSPTKRPPYEKPPATNSQEVGS